MEGIGLEDTNRKRGPGRPRIHRDVNARVKAFRDRKQAQGRRLDVYVSSKASWRLTKLSKAWGCSKGDAIERLVLEADERYEPILFPDTE